GVGTALSFRESGTRRIGACGQGPRWRPRLRCPPVKAEDLYRIPFISDAQMSPDGRRVAFVVTQADKGADENRSRIWVVGTDGDGVEGQEGGGPPPHEPYVIRRQGWKADGVGWLRRLPHLFVVDADGGEPRKLTGRDSVVTSIAWSPDGRSLAFSGSLEPDRD